MIKINKQPKTQRWNFIQNMVKFHRCVFGCLFIFIIYLKSIEWTITRLKNSSGVYGRQHLSHRSKLSFYSLQPFHNHFTFFLAKAIPYARISFRPSFLNRSSYLRSLICRIAFSQALESP